MTFIAGAFNAALGAKALGQGKAGFTIEWFSDGEMITGDNFGDEPQDMINLGVECFIQMDLLEFNAAAVQDLIWPFHATFGRGPVIGTLQSSVIAYADLVLTARSGSTAAAIEATWTFERVKLAEGLPTSVLLKPGLRTVPLRLRVFRGPTDLFFARA